MQGNGTINPKKYVQVMADVEGVPVEVSDDAKLGDVQVDVIEDTLRSQLKPVEGKGAKINETVIPVLDATVNPTL